MSKAAQEVQQAVESLRKTPQRREKKDRDGIGHIKQEPKHQKLQLVSDGALRVVSLGMKALLESGVAAADLVEVTKIVARLKARGF